MIPPPAKPAKLSFEEIKKEYQRIQHEFRALLFNAETFEEGRIILKSEQLLLDPIVDKLRLMNDLRNLDSIQIQSEKENQK